MKTMFIGVIIVAIIIAILFTMAIFMDVNSAKELQFMTLGGTDMDFLTLSFDTDIAVCNPTGFTTSFENISSILYYKDKEIGTYNISGGNFQPNVAKDVNSRFSLNSQNAIQMVLGGLFAGFTGQNIDFDENEIRIISTVDKKILGMFPTSTILTMTPSQSQSNFISGDRMGEWKCGWTPKMKQVAESFGADTSILLEEYIERANRGDTSLIDEQKEWNEFKNKLLQDLENP